MYHLKCCNVTEKSRKSRNMHKTQPKVDGGELKFFHIIPKYDTEEKKKRHEFSSSGCLVIRTVSAGIGQVQDKFLGKESLNTLCGQGNF